MSLSSRIGQSVNILSCGEASFVASRTVDTDCMDIVH